MASTNLIDTDVRQSNQSLLQAMQRVTEKEEELTALKQQLVSLRGLYEKGREQNESHKRTISQLSQALQIKENQLADQEKRESNLLEMNAKQSELEALIAKEQETLLALKEDNEKLQITLTENQQHSKQLERVIQFLRERGEEANLETQHLREEFETSQQKVELLSQQYESSKTANEKNEQELKMAQQHLGKKMKEAILMAEKNDELHHQLLTLQREYADAQTKTAALQQSMELHQHREKYLQEQLVSTSQSAESQVKKWEEKYFQVYEKWQETEVRNRAMKTLEDKLLQVQGLASNLMALFNAPLIQHTVKPAATQQAMDFQAPIPHEHPSSKSINHHPAKEEKSSIFENPAPPIRYKQNLFD